MTKFKLHAPSLVLLFWAGFFTFDGHDGYTIGIAVATVWVSVWVHTRTLLRLYRQHHGAFDRRRWPRHQ